MEKIPGKKNIFLGKVHYIKKTSYLCISDYNKKKQ